MKGWCYGARVCVRMDVGRLRIRVEFGLPSVACDACFMDPQCCRGGCQCRCLSISRDDENNTERRPTEDKTHQFRCACGLNTMLILLLVASSDESMYRTIVLVEYQKQATEIATELIRFLCGCRFGTM